MGGGPSTYSCSSSFFRRWKEEFFNMKHSSARNVIERAFGLLKGHWAILSANLIYPIRTQGRIITACYLLHNYIRQVMSWYPLEEEIGEISETNLMDHDFITHVESTETWKQWRDNLTLEMFNAWRRHNSRI